MKNLFYRASHGSRVLAILVFASVFILGEYLAVAPKPALAAGARVSICHRTKSTTNPYRFITVSNSAVAGGGHARHTGAVWTASNTNGQTWGDIIPGDDTDGDQFWSDGSGVASSAYNWDATGKSFMVPLGANLSKCTRMTAKQFYDIGIAAGQSSASILEDLEDQAANEDYALRQTLGRLGFTDPAFNLSQLETVKATTQAATSITRTSATLNGTLEVGILTGTFFEWGTSSTLSTSTTTAATPSSLSAATPITSRSISLGLTGLTAGTTYYFRAVGVTNAGTDLEGRINGDILSFAAATGSSRLLAINSSSYSGAPYELSAGPITITSSTDDATDSSGTKSYSSSTTGICTVNASTGVVTFVSIGTCTIAASISANGSDALANASAISFEITANSRTLTINSGSYSGTYTLSATPPTITSTASAGAGLKQYSSSTTSVCTINASTGVVTFVAAGTCTIAATIAANGTDAAATASSISFTVSSNPTPTTTAPATAAATTTTTTAAGRNSNVVTTGRRISICHRTLSATNPYVLITVDRNSLNGHGDHVGDIIPAPATGCPSSRTTQISTTTSTVAPGRISICHATAAGTYVQITVSRSGLNGHDDHLDDIIPAPSDGCPYSVRQYALQLVASTTTVPVDAAGSTTTLPRGKITICHATAAGFYVEITVDRNGLNGHDDHDGDIVPAPADGCPTAVQQQAAPTTTLPRGKITICHATAAGFYVEITVDRSGLNGHGDHADDMIPAPVDGCPSRIQALSSPTTSSVPAGKIAICHATSGGSYELVLVNKGQLGVHESHSQDIVPAPIGGCPNPSTTRDSSTTIPCLNSRELENFDESSSSLTDGVKVSAAQSPTDEQSGTIKISNTGSDPALTLVGVESVDPNIQVSIKSSGADYNKPITWVSEGYGAFCWKIEPFGDRDYIYMLPNPPAPPDSRYAGLPYSTVIVKAGSLTTTDPNYQVNSLFYSPTPGTGVFADVNKNGVSDPGGQGGGTLGDKAISHVVLCVGTQSTVAQAPTTTLPTSSSVAALQTTTTTINWSADFCPEPTTTTSTTVTDGSPSSSTTTTTTTTTIPASSSTTTSTTLAGESSSTTTTTTVVGSSTSTTQPGGTGDPNPPIEFIVKSLRVPESGKADLVLTLSDGVKSEVVFLQLNVKSFSVVANSLPATGQERWDTQQQLGWLMIVGGLLLGAIEFRRRATLRR